MLLLISRFHCAVDIAVCRFDGRILALVVKLFALAESDLYLYPAVLEVQRQGNQCEPLRFQQTEQLHDFALVHQQFPDAPRITVKEISFFIRGNVHVTEKQLPAVDRTPAVFEVDISASDGFDFGSYQLDSGFIGFEHKIIMPGFPVFGNLFGTGLFDKSTLLSGGIAYYIIIPAVCQVRKTAENARICLLFVS